MGGAGWWRVLHRQSFSRVSGSEPNPTHSTILGMDGMTGLVMRSSESQEPSA